MFVLPLSPSVSRRVAASRGVDHLFDASLDRLLGGAAAPSARTPALDVVESDTAYTLRFDVPGVAREQLEVMVEGRRVRLATTTPAADATAAPAADATTAPAAESAPRGERVLYRERPLPRYARTVVLPAEVDASTSQARFDHGVLTLTLAKTVPTGARKISVE